MERINTEEQRFEIKINSILNILIIESNFILFYFILFLYNFIKSRLFLEEYDRKGSHIKNQNQALSVTLERLEKVILTLQTIYKRHFYSTLIK